MSFVEELPDFMIFDAHTHIFRELRGAVGAGAVVALDYGRARIGTEIVQMLPPISEETSFLPQALMACMDWAGVDQAMLLQGPFYGDQNGEVLGAIGSYPDRLVGAAYLDPWAADARTAWARIVAANGFRAVKLECSVSTGFSGLDPHRQLASPDLAWLWNELEQRGFVLVLDLGAVGSRSYQTAAVRRIAEHHPTLKIVICHLGQIRPSVVSDSALLAEWHEQIDLGQLSNVWFDTASLPAYCASEGYPYPSVTAFLRRAVDRIGSHKLLWGSDIPGVLAQNSYRQLRELAEVHSGFLTANQQARYLFGNACRVYGRLVYGSNEPSAIGRQGKEDSPKTT